MISYETTITTLKRQPGHAHHVMHRTRVRGDALISDAKRYTLSHTSLGSLQYYMSWMAFTKRQALGWSAHSLFGGVTLLQRFHRTHGEDVYVIICLQRFYSKCICTGGTAKRYWVPKFLFLVISSQCRICLLFLRRVPSACLETLYSLPDLFCFIGSLSLRK